MTGAVYSYDTLTIESGAIYSDELNFAQYSLLAVKYAAAGTLQGTRLCVQGRLHAEDTWATIAPDLASISDELAAGQWLPFSDSAKVGPACLPYLRFYFDNGAGTAQTQTGAVALTVSMKNVSE